MPQRMIAIGDIHGASFYLDELLRALELTSDDLLIFLGDYVDRGPDSHGVIERLIELKRNHETICLLGNHELMMLRARDDASARRTWLNVGGVQALSSYAPMVGRAGTLSDVPSTHWKFLEKECVDWLETDDFICVHAGVDPHKPMPEQTELALFWQFLDPSKPFTHDSGKTIICGHTSQKSGKILDLGSCICIDTHAYAGKNLTALDLISGQYWQVNILGRLTTNVLRQQAG